MKGIREKSKHTDERPLGIVNDSFNGAFQLDTTYSNLQFHCSNTTELKTKRIESKRPPGISIGVLIKGRLEFSLDNQNFVLDTKDSGRPICFAYNLVRATNWTRLFIEGNQVMKAVLTLPKQWTDQLPQNSSELDLITDTLHFSHSQLFVCPASNIQIELVNKLISANEGTTSALELESTSLQIVIEGFKLLKPVISKAHKLNSHNNPPSRASMEIKVFLDQWLDSRDPMQPIRLSSIAKNLGASISTLQRQFQRSYNMTIVEYIRWRKLNIAKDNLSKGLNIGEVAYLSGYVHTSNFTTAFKRLFGKTPKEFSKESQYSSQ